MTAVNLEDNFLDVASGPKEQFRCKDTFLDDCNRYGSEVRGILLGELIQCGDLNAKRPRRRTRNRATIPLKVSGQTRNVWACVTRGFYLIAKFPYVGFPLSVEAMPP